MWLPRLLLAPAILPCVDFHQNSTSSNHPNSQKWPYLAIVRWFVGLREPNLMLEEAIKLGDIWVIITKRGSSWKRYDEEFGSRRLTLGYSEWMVVKTDVNSNIDGGIDTS
jgi:hypothetical protein